MKAKNKPHYVDNKKFLQAMIEYRDKFKKAEENNAKYLAERKWDLKKFDYVFKSKKRILCAPPAPPEGLFLSRVLY